MNDHSPPELDMTLNGDFVAPPKAPIISRIMMWAIIVAIVAGAIAIAAFALWLAMIILPIALGAAIVAYGIFRFQAWRAQSSLSGQRDIRRP